MRNDIKTNNCMVFRAPTELAEKARIYADEQMVSTSAICRQALNQFLNERHRPKSLSVD